MNGGRKGKERKGKERKKKERKKERQADRNEKTVFKQRKLSVRLQKNSAKHIVTTNSRRFQQDSRETRRTDLVPEVMLRVPWVSTRAPPVSIISQRRSQARALTEVMSSADNSPMTELSPLLCAWLLALFVCLIISKLCVFLASRGYCAKLTWNLSKLAKGLVSLASTVFPCTGDAY